MKGFPLTRTVAAPQLKKKNMQINLKNERFQNSMTHNTLQEEWVIKNFQTRTRRLLVKLLQIVFLAFIRG